MITTINNKHKKLNVPNLRFPEFEGEWEKCKLGELTTKVGSGSTPKGGNAVYTSVGHCFVRSQNVGMGYLILDDIAHIDDDIHQKHKATELNEDDVLLNITGASIGRTAIATKEIEGGNVNQHVCIIRANSKVSPKFLCNYIQTKKIQNYIQSLQTGGSREGLNFEQIRSFPISLPNIAEQNKNAQLLDKLNERIATQNKIIDKLQSLIKGISSKIFATIQGVEYRMGDIATITNGNSNVQDAITEAKDGLYPFFDRSEDIKYLPTFLFDKEAIIYPGEGADFMPRYFKGKFALHQRCYAIFDFNEIINAQFLYFYLKTKNSYFIRNAVGSTVPSLRLDTFQKLKVVIPSKNTQHSVSLCLSCIEQKCYLENEILQTLLKQKQFLLRQMFI